jgi:hypothetical protein
VLAEFYLRDVATGRELTMLFASPSLADTFMKDLMDEIERLRRKHKNV